MRDGAVPLVPESQDAQQQSSRADHLDAMEVVRDMQEGTV